MYTVHIYIYTYVQYACTSMDHIGCNVWNVKPPASHLSRTPLCLGWFEVHFSVHLQMQRLRGIIRLKTEDWAPPNPICGILMYHLAMLNNQRVFCPVGPVGPVMSCFSETRAPKNPKTLDAWPPFSPQTQTNWSGNLDASRQVGPPLCPAMAPSKTLPIWHSMRMVTCEGDARHHHAWQLSSSSSSLSSSSSYSSHVLLPFNHPRDEYRLFMTLSPPFGLVAAVCHLESTLGFSATTQWALPENYPLVMTNIAIENHHVLKITICRGHAMTMDDGDPAPNHWTITNILLNVSPCRL